MSSVTALSDSASPNASLPPARPFVDKKQWLVLGNDIELKLRVLVFRYPKPTRSQVRRLVMDCIGFEVRKEDAYFDKGCTKASQNISGWKYETIEAMIRWVKKLLVAKPMLANIREDKLYDEMEKNFDVHAAETVFQHMAGYYQMHVPRNSLAGVWIRDFFCNLAVMVKLHLDNPHSAEAERLVVLDFYDMFGKIEVEVQDEDGEVTGVKVEDNPAYASIKVSDFKKREDKKPRHTKKMIKRRAQFGQTALPSPPESAGESGEPVRP